MTSKEKFIKKRRYINNLRVLSTQLKKTNKKSVNKMNILEMTAFKTNSNYSFIIKMNNQTIKELRAIAKERGLRGYYKLKKAELVSLLETPIRPPRRPGSKKSLGKVTLLSKPEDMDSFELEEMVKTRPVVKSKLVEWHDWLVGYVPKSIKEPVSNAFEKVKSSIMGLYERAKKTLKGEEEAEKEHNEEDHAEGVESAEHEQAMNGAYKSFRIDGRGKTDIGSYTELSYTELVKPVIQKLVEEQVKALDAVKVQTHLWVMWKKKEEAVFTLEDGEEEMIAHEVKVEKVFNSKITEVFRGSDVEELVRGMFVQLKTDVEHPALPKSGFTLDHVMYLDIDFHKLELTRGSLHIELPEWIAKKKAVINLNPLSAGAFF